MDNNNTAFCRVCEVTSPATFRDLTDYKYQFFEVTDIIIKAPAYVCLICAANLQEAFKFRKQARLVNEKLNNAKKSIGVQTSTENNETEEVVAPQLNGGSTQVTPLSTPLTQSPSKLRLEEWGSVTNGSNRDDSTQDRLKIRLDYSHTNGVKTETASAQSSPVTSSSQSIIPTTSTPKQDSKKESDVVDGAISLSPLHVKEEVLSGDEDLSSTVDYEFDNTKDTSQDVSTSSDQVTTSSGARYKSIDLETRASQTNGSINSSTNGSTSSSRSSTGSGGTTKRRSHKYLQCEKCGQILQSNEGVMDHLRNAHPLYFQRKISRMKQAANEYSFNELPDSSTMVSDEFKFDHLCCHICRTQFEDETNLLIHLTTGHKTPTGENPCDVCGRAYSKLTILKVHRSNHFADYKFKCDQCEKKFKVKFLFERHLLTHSSVKKHICNICEASFAAKNALKNHMKKHAEFECPKCETQDFTLKFKNFYQLHAHMQTAHNEDKNSCVLCSKTFDGTKGLKSHVTQYHNFDYDYHYPGMNGTPDWSNYHGL